MSAIYLISACWLKNIGNQQSADELATFIKMDDDICASTSGAIPATFFVAAENCHPAVFDPVDEEKLSWLIHDAPAKQSSLDSTWLLKDCINLLAPYLTSIFNRSLKPATFHHCIKTALSRYC